MRREEDFASIDRLPLAPPNGQWAMSCALLLPMPSARGSIRRGELTCWLQLQPTPASVTYTVRLAYRPGHAPSATVVQPALELHPEADSLPHVYGGDRLCLYYPGEWKHHMLLANTVIPWISEWLAHYELWLVTGAWTGGGHVSNGDDVDRR